MLLYDLAPHKLRYQSRTCRESSWGPDDVRKPSDRSPSSPLPAAPDPFDVPHAGRSPASNPRLPRPAIDRRRPSQENPAWDDRNSLPPGAAPRAPTALFHVKQDLPPALCPREARAAGSEPAQHLPPTFISHHVLPGCTQQVLRRQTPRMGGLQAPQGGRPPSGDQRRTRPPLPLVRSGASVPNSGTSSDSPAGVSHRPQPDLMKTRRLVTRRSTRTPRAPKRTATCGRHHPDQTPSPPRYSQLVRTSRSREGDADEQDHPTRA